jgi:hypothetical protein
MLSLLLSAVSDDRKDEAREQIRTALVGRDVDPSVLDTMVRNLTCQPAGMADVDVYADTLWDLEPRVLFLAVDRFETSGKGSFVYRVHFPVASSELEDSRIAHRYASYRATDGDLGTSWVEGVDGPGIGERIAFLVPFSARRMGVVPGYADERYFEANNRLKDATVAFYIYSGSEQRAGNYLKPIKTVEVSFRDEMTAQEIDLPDAVRAVERQDWEYVIAVLTIESVYPGSRWNDTCIAEISFACPEPFTACEEFYDWVRRHDMVRQ